MSDRPPDRARSDHLPDAPGAGRAYADRAGTATRSGPRPTPLLPTQTKDPATKPQHQASARILLAADRSAIRSALRLLLDQKLGLSAVGEAANAAELVLKIASQPPDLLILDWQLCGARTVDLLRRVHAARPALRVLALSARPEHRSAALSAGADAFADEASSVDQLCAAVRALLERPPESRRQLIPGDAAARRRPHGAAPPPPDGTSP